MNSALIHEANSNAISFCAKVPPPRPCLEIIPIAFVDSIHLEGDNVKLLLPDSNKKESNSTPLKLGLFIVSQSPKNSTLPLFLSQFLTTSLGSFGFLKDAISVSEIYSCSSA